jgi:uncharacterized protein
MTKPAQNPFVIPLDRIPDDGLEIVADSSKDPEFAALLDALGKDTPIEASGSARLFVRKWPRRVDIEGELKATIGQVCSRGLDPYAQPIESEIRHILFQTAVDYGSSDAEVELESDDLDRSELVGDDLRLLEILEEELALALPLRPLCVTPCEGPCPSWGRDVSLEEPPPSNEPDPRWAQLAALKLKK